MTIRVFSKLRNSTLVVPFSQPKFARRLGWWLRSLALLAIIGYTSAQLQQQEAKKPGAAQARNAQPAVQPIQDVEQRRAVQAALDHQAAQAVADMEAFHAAQERAFFIQQVRQREKLAVQGALPQQLFTDEQFDQWIFQKDGSAARARRRFDGQLAIELETIDQACRLSDTQKKKLRLAGRGDIKRFFDRYERAKRKSRMTEQDEQDLREIRQDISFLRLILQADLFYEDSLLCKSLSNTLTGGQLAQYEAMAAARQAARHRINIERAIATLQTGLPLRDTQRRKLVALMTKETNLSRKSPARDDPDVLLLQLGRLPAEKLKALFDQQQWEIVKNQLDQLSGMMPMLQQAGQSLP